MLVKDAKTFGNISNGNTKMPSTSFAIDAFSCITGSKLAKIKGTPCNVCYARRLQKIRPSVDKGYKSNLEKFNSSNTNDWISAMVFQITRQTEKIGIYKHRWFDSGDLQSIEMLQAIIDVCLLTPHIKHWLPTQERDIIKQIETIPDNLVIRLSGSKINGKPPSYGNTSTVFNKDGQSFDNECPAYRTDKNSTVWDKLKFKALSRADKKQLDFGHCGDCSNCWNKNVKNVSYPAH